MMMKTTFAPHAQAEMPSTGNVIPGLQTGLGDQRERILQPDSLMARLSTLHEIVLLINAAQTREEILQVVGSEAKWLISHHVAFACLLDRAATHYVVHSLSLPGEAAELQGKRIAVTVGLPGLVIQNQAPVVNTIVAEQASTDPVEEILGRTGIKSVLLVPLRTGAGTIGALAFGLNRAQAYREIDTVTAQLLATQTGVALQNAALFEDAKKRIMQIELVNELSGELASTLDLNRLLKTAVETIQSTFGYFDVSIFFVSHSERKVVLSARAGRHTDFLPEGYSQDLSAGIVGWVATNGKHVLANDVREEPLYVAINYQETRSELAIPIRSGGEVIGVLNIEDSAVNVFDETDVTLLDTLCDQLGATIKNAQLYDQVKQSNAKLTELDRMKSDFLGIVSHDFRSPLANIVLAGKALMRKGALLDERRLHDYLTVIVDQATKLNYLAEDTLSMTRLETGQMTYHFNIVNVERLIRDAASFVNFSERHTFQCEVDGSVSLVKGDQAKLRQVVQNLLTNAVKYSPRGGKVKVLAKSYSDDQIIVSVKDEGIGIPEGQMDRLFRKFSRIDTSHGRDIEGSGLGLWICKEIVRAHGGRIWAESQQEEGSEFSFTLKKVTPGAPGH